MLYFISPSNRSYLQYLYLTSLNQNEVLWVRDKYQLVGFKLVEENIVYGYQWKKIVSQDFIDSRMEKNRDKRVMVRMVDGSWRKVHLPK